MHGLTVLAGYWPCVGGKHNAVCIHCKDYSPATRTRCQDELKRIYDLDKGFMVAHLFRFRARLPVPLGTQFDATVSTIVRDLWKADSNVKQDPLYSEFITAYHIKRPSQKQSPKPALEEGQVPTPTSTRRSLRCSHSAGARTPAVPTAELDSDTDTDTDDTEAAMVQTALQQSRLDSYRSLAAKGRGRKSEQGPSTQGAEESSPAKKQRKAGDKKTRKPCIGDYLGLSFPWWYVARALLGQFNFRPVHYHDNEDGCIPDDTSTVDMQSKLTQIWQGELPVYCRYNEDGGSWGHVYAPRGSQDDLPLPSLAVPTPAAMLPKIVKPVSFSCVPGVPV